MNTGDTAGAASTELIVAGSTTVQPVSNELAPAYMAAHQGVKITVQGGGSGAGILATAQDTCDIGSSSAALTETQKAQWPNLREYEIGGSAVVMITNSKGSMTGITGATQAGMAAMYAAATSGSVAYTDTDADHIISVGDTFTTGTGAATDVVVYQRAEQSGTEETFAGYLISGKKELTTGVGATGNSGMLKAVHDSTAPAVGFVDYGFVDSSITALTADGIAVGSSGANILTTLKGLSGGYPTKLCRNLYYLTNGQPNTLEQSYLDYVMSPAAKDIVKKAGVFSIYDYKTVA